jgi:hypothetical protein
MQQFNAVVEKQDQTLASYDWVDKDKGIVRIPIDKAMELLAQRGLPVLPQSAPVAAVPAKQAQSAKKAATQ